MLWKPLTEYAGNMITELIENNVLSFKDLENISKAVEEKRKTAVEKIPCDCLPGQCNCPEHQHEKKKGKCCSE